MDNARDIQIIRDLAKQYAEIAAKPIQDERRNLWRDHNSLIRTRPLIYVRWLAAWSEHPDATPRCEDRFWQGHEHFLRQMIDLPGLDRGRLHHRTVDHPARFGADSRGRHLGGALRAHSSQCARRRVEERSADQVARGPCAASEAPA